MKKLIAVTLIATTCACSWFKSETKTVIDNTIKCAEAEKSIALQGTDVLTLAISIAGQFAMAVMNHTLDTTVASLFAQYGEPFVACVLHNIAPNAGSGSASTGEEDPVTAAARQVIQAKGWSFK